MSVNSKSPQIVNVGKVFETSHGKAKILEYVSAKEVYIEFEATGYKRKTSMSALSNGVVRDLYHPTVQGFGFIGEGKHVISDKKNGISKSYYAWSHIMNRAKSPLHVAKKWHNFQNFADWFEKNKKANGKMICIKKFKDGGNYYSPDTCKFMTPDEQSEYVDVCRGAKGRGGFNPKIDIMTALRLHGRKIDFGRVAAI